MASRDRMVQQKEHDVRNPHRKAPGDISKFIPHPMSRIFPRHKHHTIRPMSLNAIQPISPTIQLTPLMESLHASNDKLPKSNNPIQSEGTIQQNSNLLPEVTLYNSHGILSKSNPNSLIAFA